ncbi:MAG: O-methyltransferase [Actinomycetia bacterium]|nr:O-methyltransferase [Actinomycetes bacterium]
MAFDVMIGTTSLNFVENWLTEDEPLRVAREHADELGTCPPVGSGTGATLRLLAAAVGARTAVEVGTGTGTSGIWLLRGMRPDGVLTTIDLELEHQRLAREAFTAAGLPPNRYRLINGSAHDVLPRLTDGAYDMVFIDAEKTGYSDYLAHAVRLARHGGVIAFDNALRGDQVANLANRNPSNVAVREVIRAVRDDERLLPALLPVGDGMLAAVKR